MEKFIPCEKLSKKGSEWQRSARCKSASPDAASAGHRRRNKRKINQAKRQTWDRLNPVTRKPANSKVYNRSKSRTWRRGYQRTNSGIFVTIFRNAPDFLPKLTFPWQTLPWDSQRR